MQHGQGMAVLKILIWAGYREGEMIGHLPLLDGGNTLRVGVKDHEEGEKEKRRSHSFLGYCKKSYASMLLMFGMFGSNADE